MKKDFGKLLTEGGKYSSKTKNFKSFRGKNNSDLSPSREGIKSRYHEGWSNYDSHFSYKLIDKFILSRVNSSWDRIYSEVCTNFPPNHVFRQNVINYMQSLCKQVYVDEHGKFVWHYNTSKNYLSDGIVEFYIEDGLLKKCKDYQTYKKRNREIEKQRAQQEELVTFYPDEKLDVVFRKIDNIWYEFTLWDLPRPHKMDIGFNYAFASQFEIKLGPRRIAELKLLPVEIQKATLVPVVRYQFVNDCFLGVPIYLDECGVIRTPNSYKIVKWGHKYKKYHVMKKVISSKLKKKYNLK